MDNISILLFRHAFIADLVECLDANDNDCDTNAECTNTVGSYSNAGSFGSPATPVDWKNPNLAGSNLDHHNQPWGSEPAANH